MPLSTRDRYSYQGPKVSIEEWETRAKQLELSQAIHDNPALKYDNAVKNLKESQERIMKKRELKKPNKETK